MTAVKCNKCGAPNDIEPGSKFIKCKYCDSQMYVDKSGIGFFYILPYQPGFSNPSQLAGVFKRWAAGSKMAKDLEATAHITGMKQQYFPVYMFRRDIQGAERVFVQPAKSTTLPGMHALGIPPGDLKIFDQNYQYGDPGVVELVKPDIEMMAYLSTMPGTPKEQALVFFPIWSIQYNYQNTKYSVVIDGSSGTVYVSDFPIRKGAPYGIVAGAGFVAFILETLLFSVSVPVAAVLIIATVCGVFGGAYYVAKNY